MSDDESPSRRAYREAREQAELDHPLPGEDTSSRDPSDIAVWLTTYSELLRFKEAVIATARERSATLTEPAREEVAATDLVVLEAERARFARRHAFWERRRLEGESG